MLVILITLIVPMLALFLVCFAANQVEGLALAKGAGNLVLSTTGDLFSTGFVAMGVIAVLSTFWPAKLFLLDEHFEVTFGYFSAELTFQLGLIWYLYATFIKKVE